MTLLLLVLINTGCEEQINPTKVPSEEGKMVEVSLNVGFADEADGYTLATKSDASSGKGAFSYELQPSVVTKGDATMKPDKLYYLEIQQYDRSGNHIGGIKEVIGEREIGSTIELSLQEDSDCQLVIVAWGYGNTDTKNRLGTSSLADVQKLSLDATSISNLDPEKQSDMNKMPYVLHLEHVDATTSVIRSLGGKDVRLLLKRLAARLTLNWTYLYNGYKLNQILLESIPTNYNVVPDPDKTDNTYPSLLDQFTTIKIDPSGKSFYSCWIPANVRGSNSSATSQTYRIKSNAPTGSSYASFIADNTSDAKKKLNYRVYLGGSSSFDFNINSNTNYNYTVTFNHPDLPVNDRRVTIIDPIPASENNNNLVPTANCFMVVPGSSFCFDPFKYQINGSNNNLNTTLQEWAKSGGIAYVRLLWQTKENGDVGDPVLGVVTSADDHTNVVDVKRIDGGGNILSNPATDKDQAYIYCRVAPNTTGGSGAIAAYNANDQILWSWHIWVTDYHPDATGSADVQTPENKRKQKYEYGSYINSRPMMDRNLGAVAGYTNLPPNDLEKSKTNGFYYQWGRKDPFRGSYSNTNITQVLNEDIKENAPTKGLLSLFKADGFTFYPMSVIPKQVSYRDAYKDPGNMYKIPTGSSQWINSQTSEYRNAWGGGGNKGLHDPCPAGWRIANKANYYQLFKSGATGALRLKEGTNNSGYVIYYDKEGVNTTYFYLAGYWSQFGLTGINGNLYMWCGDVLTGGNGKGGSHLIMNGAKSGQFLNTGNERESLLVRCIQECE